MSYQELVIEIAGQRPATLKDFRTQELALERQTQLWELSKFEPIGTRQEEIEKKFCRFQIREEGSRLNIATQNAIGFALSRFLDQVVQRHCRFKDQAQIGGGSPRQCR